jgi:hypothetical protein
LERAVSTTATVVVSILGFIAFFYVNLYAGSYRMRRAASAFLSALAQRRHTDAHALLTSAFQESVPDEDFERFLAERGIAAIKMFTRSHGDFSIGVDTGTVKPLLIREDGVHFPIELAMRREGMAWRVAAIDALVRLAPGSWQKAANDAHVHCMKVRVSPSYWSMFRAQLRMLFYSPLGWILSTAFPLGGGYMMYRWNTAGGAPSIPDLLIAGSAVLGAPLYAAFIVFLMQRNETAHRPFTFAFDSEGIKVVSEVQTVSKSWREVVRVTESAGFMFIFVSRGVAHVVPLRALQDAGYLNEVRGLVQQKVASRT